MCNEFLLILNCIIILLYSLQRRINNHSDNEQFLLSSRGHAAGVGTRRSSNRFLSASEVWKRYSTNIHQWTELKWETALSPCMTVQHYMIYLRIVRNYGSSKNLNVKWCGRPDFIVSMGFQQCRWVSTSLGLKLSRPTLRKPSPSLSEESGDVSSWAAPPSTKKICHNLNSVEFAGGLKIEVRIINIWSNSISISPDAPFAIKSKKFIAFPGAISRYFSHIVLNSWSHSTGGSASTHRVVLHFLACTDSRTSGNHCW